MALMAPAPTRSAAQPLSGMASSNPAFGMNIGMTGIVSDLTSAASVFSDEIRRSSVQLQQAAQFSSTIEKNFSLMAKTVKAMNEDAARSAHQVSLSADKTSKSVQTGSFDPSDPTAGGHPRAGGRPEMRETNRQTFRAGQKVGQNMDSLKASASDRADQWMSEWKGNRPKPPRMNAAGKYIDGQGRFVPQQAAADEAAQYGRVMSRVGRVQGAVNAIGAGEGMSGALGAASGAAAKFLGPAGVAFGAAQMINSQMISQRAENAKYQQIYGGANTDAFGQRAQETMFSRFGTLGVMGSDQATQLFQGVSATGQQGAARQESLDFAVNQYKKTGMDVSTSLELIRTATENGTNSMSGLSAALGGVADAAKKTGVNLGEAQKAFALDYAKTAKTITGQGASEVAGVASAFRTGLGKGFEDVNVTDAYSTRPGEGMLAASLGMNLNEFNAQKQKDPSIVSRGLQASLDQGMDAALHTDNGTGMASIQASAAAMRKKPGGMTKADWQSLGNDMQSQEMFNPHGAISILANRGFPGLTEANIGEFMAKRALGDDSVNIGKQGKIADASLNKGGFVGAEATTIGANDIRGFGFGDSVWGARVDQDKELAEKFGTGKDGAGSATALKTNWRGTAELGNDSNLGAYNAYTDNMHRTGKRLGGVENLIAQKLSANSRFSVKGADGTMKEVGLTEAVKSYSDQLESGDVQITKGSKAGQTVGGLTGVLDKEPMAAKAKADAAAAKNGKITLEAIGPLAAYIKMTTTGSVSQAAARRGGTGADPFPAAATLPSGSGYASTYGTSRQ